MGTNSSILRKPFFAVGCLFRTTPFFLDFFASFILKWIFSFWGEVELTKLIWGIFNPSQLYK